MDTSFTSGFLGFCFVTVTINGGSDSYIAGRIILFSAFISRTVNVLFNENKRKFSRKKFKLLNLSSKVKGNLQSTVWNRNTKLTSSSISDHYP